MSKAGMTFDNFDKVKESEEITPPKEIETPEPVTKESPIAKTGMTEHQQYQPSKVEIIPTKMRAPEVMGDAKQDVFKLYYEPKNAILKKRSPETIHFIASTTVQYRVAPYLDGDMWFADVPRELGEALLGEEVPSWHLVYPEKVHFSRKKSHGRNEQKIKSTIWPLIKAGKKIYKETKKKN